MAEQREQKKPLLWLIEDVCCGAALVLLALLPLAELGSILLFHTGIPNATGLMIHILLVLALLSGMITTRQGEHLSIVFLHYLSDEKIKRKLSLATNGIAAFVAVIILWCSLAFVVRGLSPWRIIVFIPDQIFALVIPLGYAVMAFRFIRLSRPRGLQWIIPALSVILGTLFALPAITLLFWGLNVPPAAAALTARAVEISSLVRLPLIIVLLLSALAGAPLFVVLGGLALILVQSAGGQIVVVADQIYNSSVNTLNPPVPIPLFTLVGFLLSESRAGERLVKTFRCLFSWIPGGMIIASVIICAFFTSFTGASGVTILALGGILAAILAGKSGYPEKFTVGLLTSVGGVGLLFPPSLPLILVAAIGMIDPVRLFAGALIPGGILVLAMIAFGIAASVKFKIPCERFSRKEALDSFKGAAWEIALPILLLGGYFSGFLSLIDLGAVAAAYVFIVEVFIHRDIKIRDLPRVFAKAVPIIGGVLSILAISQALFDYIIYTKTPENLVHWLQGAIESKWLFLLLLNLALLAAGCLMDIFSAILVLLPLILPLGEAYGVDPVHLGIVFLINMEVGFLTPPVGMNLFLATYRFKKPFIEVCRNVVPFLLIQLAVVLLVTYLPFLSTWILRFF